MRTFKTAKGTELLLIDLKGKDYLQVNQRLVWFREERPLWSIRTEFVRLDDKTAIAKATITNEAGFVMAIGHKREDMGHFQDFTEKAETGAIGRALALCGFGTQYAAADFDEGERLADAPVERKTGVFPEHPAPGNGISGDRGYRIPFGKYAKRSLEEIEPEELRGYVEYIERKAGKDGKPLSGPVADFVERATQHIVAMEAV